MKPIEQTRREFLRAAGKGVLGAAALTAIPSVLKPALAETAASPAYPWTYQQVDKDAVLKHTYDCFYSHGGCCAAVFAGIMETMGRGPMARPTTCSTARCSPMARLATVWPRCAARWAAPAR